MNTREEILNFKPHKEFFVGIDSDGTAFDSMNIKHLKAFLPAALKVWDFGIYREEFEKIWAHLNLYSETRGINRFLGLVCAMEQMGNRTGRAWSMDTAPLRNFVDNSESLSNAGLEAWMRKRPAPLLETVFRWSLESDRLFEEHTQGLLPFREVEASLKGMAEKADVMVVSSASGKGLDKDWSFSGLTRYTTLLAGQETGNKQTQLALGASGKYPSHKILMIGDAPGDLEAARSVGALFYPIIPGREEASWLRLREEGLPRFFAESWQGEYQNHLTTEFLEFLKDPV